MAGRARPCRFAHGGKFCSCANFTAAEASSICQCGHKSSSHRSDFASRALSEAFATQEFPWEDSSREGLVVAPAKGRVYTAKYNF